MIDPQDLYTCTSVQTLMSEGSNQAFGTSVAQYEMRRYDDVRNLGSISAYLVTLRHRLIIPNPTAYQPGPQSATSYSGYPAVITNNLTLNVAGGGILLLKDFFPKTLNSAISTSATTSTGGTTSTSNEATSGSSTSQTNTFGVDVSGGMFMDAPVFNVGVEYQHGWQSGRYSSATTGSATARQTGASQADQMSVKDWSAYGFADQASQLPNWIWSQSYPWDAVENNFGLNNQIVLPDYVQARLLGTATVSDTTTNFVLPPSQLSLFGIDFTMKAGWLVSFPDGVSASEAINFAHVTSCYRGGHSLDGSAVSATLDTANLALTASFASGALDMSRYALDPIMEVGPANGAAIGFTANPFTIPPTSARGAFKIVSPANNLQVDGSGFDASMVADFSVAASLTISFKVVDRTSEFALLMMHWIAAGSDPCKLTFTINGTHNVIAYVDAEEGEGGQNNVTAIELRNSDFTSINFHDYLVLGLNTVTVAVEPSGNDKSAYTLFAVAVGQA